MATVQTGENMSLTLDRPRVTTLPKKRRVRVMIKRVRMMSIIIIMIMMIMMMMARFIMAADGRFRNVENVFLENVSSSPV